jgi:hypothetical protein
MGEVPVSASAITLSAFSGAQLPPSITAQRTNLPILFKQFTLGTRVPSPATAVGTRDQGNLSFQQQVLNEQPLTALVPKAVQNRIDKFAEAVNEALELSNTMAASEESDPLDEQTFLYAIQSLVPLIMSLKLPPPLILPLQSGGIGAEWHTGGMNIELRFRKPYDIYAVFEDARGAIEPFHSRDPDLARARSALRELSTRSVDD